MRRARVLLGFVLYLPASSLDAQDTARAPVVAPAGASLELLAAAIGAASRREPIAALSGTLNCDPASAALDSASVQMCELLGSSGSLIVAEFARALGRPADASWPTDPARELPVCEEERSGPARRDDRRRDRFARIAAPVVGERDGKWEGRMTLELSCRVVRADGRADVRTLAREYLCQWDGRAWRLYQVATRRITD